MGKKKCTQAALKRIASGAIANPEELPFSVVRDMGDKVYCTQRAVEELSAFPWPGTDHIKKAITLLSMALHMVPDGT